MEIFEETLSVSTTRRSEMVDLTDKIQSVVKKSGINNGDAIIYCPHTTAAITNYKKSLDLNVENDNARAILTRLVK